MSSPLLYLVGSAVVAALVLRPLLSRFHRSSLAPSEGNQTLLPSTSSTARDSKHPPITNRTKAEIASYGDFPDYAKLSGVPLPMPYNEFDIKKALPRPYRPFRWAYHQTMSHKKMESDWWLELENTYPERIAQRVALYEQYGKDVLDSMPGTESACKELMEMCLTFLVNRYPKYFSLEKSSPAQSAPDVFINGILGKQFRIKEMHPLLVLLHNVPEDFAMVYYDENTKQYYFKSGMICSALGWNVSTKFKKSLRQIHFDIPDYNEKMAFSMDRYFTKIQPNEPIQRGSWGLEYKQPLYMPPNDPQAEYRTRQDPNMTLDDVYLRVDWQTLRRLPLSGAVVFNFKAVFTPLKEFRDERCMPALMLKILNEGKKELMEYKGTWHVEHVAKPALEQWKKEQEENGLCPKDWKVETLDDYPLFAGWESKWHRQQGY